ncbi:MAG TPA: hypothetical protein VMB21_09085 [Candidatus Limnocylindria bacterium]|nr:hypothetical protein [Candidatus Limnocylindria bacterium]
MRLLKDEELWAQACLQQALPDARVEQHDDGSEDGMFDLKIIYSDDSAGAVEVTMAADRKYIELGKQLDRQTKDWHIPGLSGSWWVSVLPTARVQDLRQQLPAILRKLESGGVEQIHGNAKSPNALAKLIGRLQIIAAYYSSAGQAGRVFVIAEASPEKMGGYSPPTGDLVATWLGSWLGGKCQVN